VGEISDALRRARQERERHEPFEAPGTPPVPALDADASDEAERDAGATVSIADTAEGHWVARAVRVDARGPVAEHYRHFALRVSRTLAERQAHSLLVTSAMRAEGKTTTCCNLALALASIAGGRRIALVEVDLRKPAIGADLGVEPPVGFESVLAGEARLREARLRTDQGALDLFVVKQTVDNPLDLLSGTALPAALRELRRHYDVVLLDTPPVLPVPDVPLIQPHVDALLLVARAGVCRRHAFRSTLEALDVPKVIGVFLNATGVRSEARYYGYYAYGDESRDESARTRG
jgi:capsular exopolysaccharide synthesis family protein